MKDLPTRLGMLAAAIGLLAVAGCTSGSPATTAGASSAEVAVDPYITSADLQAAAAQAIDGRTLAFVPFALGAPLYDEWNRVIGEQAAQAGFEYVVQDPGGDASRQAQATEALIGQLSERDVLVVHNVDVAVLAKLLEQAENKGIYVIELNMASNFKGDALVGANLAEIGRQMGEDIAQACAGTSGKVAILTGSKTASFDIDLIAALESSLANHPEIEVVASQLTGWDRNKGHDVMATLLQQHPDLCATAEDWDYVSVGTGLAIKEAGKLDQVKVFSTDSSVACKAIEDGLIYRSYSFNPTQQAVSVVSLASFLVQSGNPAGSSRTAIYSEVTPLDASNYDQSGACYDGKGGDGLSSS